MRDSPRRSRRRHSAAIKAQVIAPCALPGASVASANLARDFNTNPAHRRWRAAGERGRIRRAKAELAKFGPKAIAPLPVAAAPEVIVIELRRGACAVRIA